MTTPTPTLSPTVPDLRGDAAAEMLMWADVVVPGPEEIKLGLELLDDALGSFALRPAVPERADEPACSAVGPPWVAG